MKVTANSAFNAVHQCQILALAEGQEIDGDTAAYLLRTGADVSAADDEAEAYVDELNSARATGESPAVDALPVHQQRTEEPGTRLVEEKPQAELTGAVDGDEVADDEQSVEVVETKQAAEESDGEPVVEETAGQEQIDVANSNISTVLAWVGDDKDRAIAAFDAESDRGDAARSTLLDQLSKIAD